MIMAAQHALAVFAPLCDTVPRSVASGDHGRVRPMDQNTQPPDGVPMNGDRRRTGLEGQRAIPARTIVTIGVWCLLMVLLGTMSDGATGLVFFAGVGLLFATVITFILVTQYRGTGSEP